MYILLLLLQIKLFFLFNSGNVADDSLSVRMKYHVYSVLANIGAALPCISDWSSGLPRVTGRYHHPGFNMCFLFEAL